MRKKRIIVLTLQIIVILISVFLLTSYTNNQIKLTEVFVYTKNISDVSQPLKAGDVKKIKIPVKAVTKDFAVNEEDIVGKHVDSKVKAGQYVYKSQLVTLEEVDVFQTMDLSKHRKISLPISFVDGFSGNIKRGDKVDLVYIGGGSKESDDSDGGSMNFSYSKVFMQDVLVYSVNRGDGYKFVDHSQRIPGYGEDKEDIDVVESGGSLDIITLAVTLEQAEEIETRMAAGQIRFLGRFDDSESYNTLGYVLGNYGKVFSGPGFAETDNLMIEEDDFDIIEIKDLEEVEEKEKNSK